MIGTRFSNRRFAAVMLLLLSGLPLFADQPVSGKAPTKTVSSITSSNLMAAAPSGTNTAVNTNVPITMDTLDDKHTLALGDKVSYRVIEDGDPAAAQLVVTDSGDLEIPLAGRYPVVGLTCKKLAWTLKEALEKEYYYHATVILAVDAMSHTRGRIYVEGAVRAAGPQEIPSDEVFTLSKAIDRAGGLTDYAKGNKVRITRKDAASGKDTNVLVNVEKILQKGNREGDMTLQADDFIWVPESGIRF